MLKKLLFISLFWATLILLLCFIPGNALPKTPAIPYLDKFIHLGLYFILSVFLIPVFDFSHHKYISKAAPFIIILITCFYGGIIEIAQEKWFINRSGDIVDFYSDLAGGLLAIIVYYILVKRIFIRWKGIRKG